MEKWEKPFLEQLQKTMTIADMATVPLSMQIAHIRGVLRAIKTFMWEIPQDVFFDYLLPFRVNDERFELYIDIFYEVFGHRIKGMNMERAALEVNYICLENVTYRSTDDRTMGALSVYKSGYGRCGEESVFLIAALRSVGIPARQCYVPHWAHCDDNHAWVEVWVEGHWRFMGACEPEERLDIGWFNSASSKASIVRHRCLKQAERKQTSDENSIYYTEESTKTYAKAARLTVMAERDSRVSVYIINYGGPSLLREKLCNGQVEFELGLGDYLVFASGKQGYDIAEVKLRFDKIVKLELSSCPEMIEYELSPPAGELPPHELPHSRAHLERCALAAQKRIIKTEYYKNSSIEEYKKLSNAAPDKQSLLLSLLSEKDLRDVTLEVLLDAETSFALYGNDANCRYVLSPRVANEHLYPCREYVRERLSHLETAEQVYAYLSGLEHKDELEYPYLFGDLRGMLEMGAVTEASLPVYFVQICRALGMAARLDPVCGLPQYLDSGVFRYVKKTDMCSIKISSNENIAICAVKDIITPINVGSTSCELPCGLYAVTASKRQIDGSCSGRIVFTRGGSISFPEIEDNTEGKLKNVNLDKLGIELNGKCILAFVQNAAEPTEHFLNELIESRGELDDISVVIVNVEADTNDTLRRVLDMGIAQLNTGADKLDEMRDAMQVGDHRLPFITAVYNRTGLYSFANYNVGTVSLLIELLRNKQF